LILALIDAQWWRCLWLNHRTNCRRGPDSRRLTQHLPSRLAGSAGSYPLKAPQPSLSFGPRSTELDSKGAWRMPSGPSFRQFGPHPLRLPRILIFAREGARCHATTAGCVATILGPAREPSRSISLSRVCGQLFPEPVLTSRGSRPVEPQSPRRARAEVPLGRRVPRQRPLLEEHLAASG
jgi:hypothetical protein